MVLLRIGSFLAACNEYQSVDSSMNHIAKKEAKAEAEAAMRKFASSSVRFNPRMTDSDKLALGIHVRDTHPSPRPNPTDLVEFQFKSVPSAHLIIIPYHIAGSVTRGKGHYHGVEVRIWVLPLDAPEPQDADHPGWRSEVNTATPWKHTFTREEIGQRLYVCMRWENRSVNKDHASGRGPWSAIHSVVIA
jgi:hypothetical protein